MKKKLFSISILMVLAFSMAFSGIQPATNNIENVYEPISAVSPSNAILELNDVLYYNVAEEGYDEWEDRYYDDSFIVKLVVNETDPDYIKYMPYFYEFDGSAWNWVSDTPDSDDPHLYDDYTLGVYNHSWSINTTITDISVVNSTEDIQGKFATDISCSDVTASFSTSADDYHNVTMSGLMEDNVSKPVSIKWIANKTTGIVVYYEEKGFDSNNITAELCGYEIADTLSLGLLEAPTSFGFAVGDWVDYFVPESGHYDDPPPPPTSSGDSYYYDWLERGNDDWTTAFRLNDEFDVPGHWYDLSLHDNFDYYSFHAENGDNIVIDAWCDMGADIRLERLDPGNGNVMVSDGEDGDTNGHMYLDWTADYSGDYMIGFTSDYGPFSDWYDFQISINGYFGPDYFGGMGPDGHDGPESMFVHQTVEFLYTNPFGDDVLVVKSEGHKDADMMDDPLFIDYREQGRILSGDINLIEGPYFHKDLDMTSGVFQTSMEDLFSEDDDITISTFNSDANWVEMIGVDGEGLEFYFFAERFHNHNYGGIQYYEMSLYNSTDDYFMKKDKNIAIDSSIAGLINDTVGPELGVSVGDEWTYLAQEEGYENNWDEFGGYSRSFENVHYVTVTVTHVFHVNRTVVAVIGSMDHWSNDDPDYPDHKDFMPLLVWDTEDPISFFTMGGHGMLEDGPPFLLPAGVDWSLLESEFTSMMEMLMDSGSEVKIDIDTFSVRIAWESDDSYGSNHGNVYLDLNSYGIVTHIAQDEKKSDENYERRNRLEGFAVEITVGATDVCSPVSASDVTDVVTGDVFVWERQQYHPAGMWGPDDPGRDPANYTHMRNRILSVEEACDGFIVFLGTLEERKWDETDYTGKTWKYWDESIGDYVDSGFNSWLLGSIQDGNIWSWVNSQYFDKGIANFSGYEIILAELLNFAMELPDGYSIHPTDITVDGLTFEVIMTFEESPGVYISHVMRLAVNNKGIMQEMFMGSRDSSDVWLEWEYTVLIDAPAGYETGGVFSDLPVEETHDIEGDPSSPFDIPGYPMIFISIIALASIAAIIRKSKK